MNEQHERQFLRFQTRWRCQVTHHLQSVASFDEKRLLCRKFEFFESGILGKKLGEFLRRPIKTVVRRRRVAPSESYDPIPVSVVATNEIDKPLRPSINALEIGFQLRIQKSQRGVR
jgi:hypothetical protein